MRRATVIVTALTLALCLAGCEDVNEVNDRFEVVGGDLTRKIMVDRETGVEYLQWDRGITVLLDADGNPLVYEGVE